VTVSPESLVSEKSGAGSPSLTAKAPSKRRAVGIVRVSHVGDRAENIISPSDQEARIRAECRRLGLRLLSPVVHEMDVSGRTPLDRRAGLRGAVEAVEAGRAEVIVVAYMDRLVRSLRVQLEVVERVERAGGEILTLDRGALTNGNAAQQLQAHLIGAFHQYQAAAGGERSREGKVKAVREGRAPYPNVPPGIKRGGAEGKGPLELDPQTAEVVREAFRMRAGGESIAAVRVYLREQGIARSFHGVQAMLRNRLYIGELRFGDLVNLGVPALIDVVTFERAQRQHIPRGPRPKSERLLARLGVLRCATCDSRMVVGQANPKGGKTYALYRCDPLHDCPRRVTISAPVAEQVVEDEVRLLLAGMRGKASAESGPLREAEADFERCQNELTAATKVLLGVPGIEEEATERLSELHQAREDALERLEDLRSIIVPDVVVDASADWSILTLDERRALIRAVIARAVVAPGGKGAERVTVEARV
jgi:DNA invertase Pin-like site-specific DNA recombinase